MQRRSLWLSVCTAVIGYVAGCSPVGEQGATPAASSIASGGSPNGALDPGVGAAGSAGEGGDPVASGGAAGGDGEGVAVGAPLDPGGGPALSPSGTLGGDAGSELAAGDAGVAPPNPQLERLSALSARLAPLAERTVGFWLAHGPDASFSGFHATLDRQGNPIAPEDKGLIQQSRHLWMLSTWYDRRQATPELLQLAAQQYSFLRESFVDAADGAFVYKVSRDGSRVVDAKKQMFAESYAIYALATYGRVFGQTDATELALARFASIDASRHDAQNGGYDQRSDPGDLPAGWKTQEAAGERRLLPAGQGWRAPRVSGHGCTGGWT